MTLWIILSVVALMALYVMGTYNSLVGLRNRVQDQWAQVDVLLKRRFDLIPNLVETVKGYASHEKSTLDAVISARNKFNSATTPEAEMAASGELTRALGRIMMLTEAYPDLKADKGFLQLQENLKETEDKISYARQFYNDRVLGYKNKLEMFPSNIVGSLFKFKVAQFFEAEGTERETPKVSFS